MSEIVVLKKLEVAGFKSFGGRKIFEFHSGISAIVGPNGSGKSNIADAIRWVLGEQKARRLRVGKTEDLIFHGTEKKPRASMAHVKLLLDNSTGKIPLDLVEIEISRQLLRSGESEYRLNGRRVRLTDIEELLARAGFGKESYTVIGQGMIEQFLSATGVERKTLFDEASGIRQYDIRRTAAKKTLNAAATNLTRAEDVLKELRPAQALLQQQNLVYEKKHELTTTLHSLREDYLISSYTQTKAIVAKDTSSLEKLQQQYKTVERELDELRSVVNTSPDAQLADAVTHLTEDLKALELERDSTQHQLLLMQAELTAVSQQVNIDRSIEKELSQLQAGKRRLEQQIAGLHQKHATHEGKTAQYQKQINEVHEQLQLLTKDLNTLHLSLAKSQKKDFLSHSLGLVQLIRSHFSSPDHKQETITALTKLNQMLHLAFDDDTTQTALSIGRLQNTVTGLMERRENLTETQTQEVIFLRSLEMDISSAQTQLSDLDKQEALLDQHQKEQTKLQAEVHQHQTTIAELETRLTQLDNSIKQKRDEIYTANDKLTKANNPADSQYSKLEKTMASRTQLEIKISQTSEAIAGHQQKLSLLQSQASEWFGRSFSFKEQPGVRTVKLSQIEETRIELQMIEDIDPAIIEESKQAAERIEFLETQKHDLNQAIEDTTKLISSLEKDMEVRFTKNFKRLNMAFQKHFVDLFDGGEASLELQEETEGEYGIEINVQPPGKRSRGIAALSGGEKTLAAIALISAILTTNPSPFIVLDEVDAALDDENSTKFNTILRELARHSQIIVITHNHETMQAAHHLYGITTTKKGDSEVVSLALSQAEELVAT